MTAPGPVVPAPATTDAAAARPGGPAGPGPGPDPDVDPDLVRVADLVRDVPDYPSPGVLFRDITPVLADAAALATVTTELAALVGEADLVVAVEARGFLLGSAAAVVAGVGVVPVRKAGKLPHVAARRSYALEYGEATLELPADTVPPGARVCVIDDVLATGGTVAATVELVRAAGAQVVGVAALLELPALGGRARIASALTSGGSPAAAPTAAPGAPAGGEGGRGDPPPVHAVLIG